MIASILLVTIVVQAAPVPSPLASASAYVPQRVFETHSRAFSDFEAMLADLSRADVILVGEQHDDPNTHRLEAAILEGLFRRRVRGIVSLEMFERDVQSFLDQYFDGRTSEDAFLNNARPWPQYSTDYRPLVEFAKSQRWKVLAANVPRRYASNIAKTGLTALDRLAAADRDLIATDLICPLDAYFDRFANAMRAHPDAIDAQLSPEEQGAVMVRYYQAQCVKDETMAESIATALDKQGDDRATLVHFTGAFHVDFGQGTAQRVRRRLPARRVAIVTILPVADMDSLKPADEDPKRADYLIYTLKENAK